MINLTLLHAVSLAAEKPTLGKILLEVLSSTLEITFLVILMMAIIELINVSSSGKLMLKLQKYPFLQTAIACLLGSIPGCAGGFAVVSMFTHRLLTFGALMGGMIATFGDEAFFLFAKDPKWGAILTLILFGIGLVFGTIFNLLGKKWKWALEPHEFEIHEEHSHNHAIDTSHRLRHFFQKHLWEHVIKEHFLSVFLWSFGVLLFIKAIGYFVDIHALLEAHEWAKFLLLLIAVLIGFIPESGPHLIFIMMFLEGQIPFAILLANAIAQNGHAGLPLLAQSRKNFFIMKLTSMSIGLLFGAILLIL